MSVQKILIVNPFAVIHAKDHNFLRADIILSKGQEVVECDTENVSYLGDLLKELEALSADDKVIITGAQTQRSGKIWISRRSTVFRNVADFPVNEAVVQQFRNPAVLKSVEEVQRSPLKRRLSFAGTVKEVNNSISGDNWTMKKLILQDNRDDIPVVLWNTETNVQPNMHVEITNLKVDMYKNERELVSTRNTRIIQNARDGTRKITVEAYNDHTIISSTDTYSHKLGREHLPKEENLPYTCLATIIGGYIVQLSTTCGPSNDELSNDES